jgi:oxygen-dependent protoporphyrinogen oxidase
VSVGRDGAPPPDVGDVELIARVEDELDEVLRLRHSALLHRVARFGEALPQYDVGHVERVARLEEALPATLLTAGAAYRGAGIPACLRSGRDAAARILEDLPRRRVIPSPRSSP